MAYERLTDRVGWIPGGVNTGVIRLDDRRVAVIDPGLNETSGKRVIKTIREELGSEVVAIVTTHAHADHFGANASVVKRTGARVYAPAIDELILRFPILQPAMLFGGSDPLDALRIGFLLAELSPVDQVIDGPVFELGGVEITVVPLWGHSARQVGYLIDGVLFSADVLLPETALAKYPIPYMFSLTDHQTSIDSLPSIAFDVAVPGHGSAMIDVSERRRANRDAIDRVAEAILDVTQIPSEQGDIVAAVSERVGAAIVDAPSYYLVQPTIGAFLSHLERVGELHHAIVDRRSVWSRR